MSAIQDLKVPKSIGELNSKSAEENLQRIEDLLNALQNLKVQITDSGGTRTTTANIQFSGKSAVLIVEL